MPAARKKLPIGIQTFADIIEGGYYYVDKTPHIHRLVEEGKYYFLSRPRRFGKSLLVDTLAEAFAGSRELFEGLYLESHWDWSRRYPVLRFDFGRGEAHAPAALEGKKCGSACRERSCGATCPTGASSSAPKTRFFTR